MYIFVIPLRSSSKTVTDGLVPESFRNAIQRFIQGDTAATGQRIRTIYPGFSVDLEIIISLKIRTYYLKEMVDIS